MVDAEDSKIHKLEAHLKTRCDPYKVNGLEFTYHAMAQMMLRHIRLDWVREALKEPVLKVEPGKHRYRGQFATIYVNPIKRIIITVAAGRCNDPLNGTTNYSGHKTHEVRP